MSAINRQVFRHGTPTFIDVKVAYSQAIKKGEMLKRVLTTGLCIPVTQAADNDSFYVIADSAHVALTADDGKAHYIRGIVVDPSCVFEFPVYGTPDLGAGIGLSIRDSQTLQLAATDHVAIAVEAVANATTCKVVFLTPPAWGGASQNVSFDALT